MHGRREKNDNSLIRDTLIRLLNIMSKRAGEGATEQKVGKTVSNKCIDSPVQIRLNSHKYG